ncbi:enoyl-CoA hydratase/isomerase family protein [Aestuariicella hydrocarbonica]|uniref:Enoyl-CoA hydratase/isomerase family protein n=1 Tax=Pseudomaricurvus hydrocarbonicus TaxID=1470433 RepID=A0A9E5JW80_9GAMM|nr:enoyl-CoA hydratase/isomerase family protein [Aestuariicella hydrocarbonica]NHO66631.1 enoyl-CoA hydratase/isomerase family protein [Aestuariicella hydrocarbonica]
MAGHIQITHQDQVTVLVLDNPGNRNAMSTNMVIELINALEAAFGASDCRAIVLTGLGEHFCAGGDVSEMQADRPMLGSRLRIERAHRIVRLLNGGPKPVVCAVEGFAYGLGLSLAMASDFVVASETASFCAVFNKVGLIPDMGLMWSLPQRVGVAQAKQLFFTARQVKIDEAQQLGMVDQRVAAGSAETEAIALAQQMAAAAPIPVALVKAAYAKGDVTLDDVLRTEVDHQPALYLSQDHNEGVAAFRERRAPVFTGH